MSPISSEYVPKPVQDIPVREMGRDFGISCSTFCSTEGEGWEMLSRKFMEYQPPMIIVIVNDPLSKNHLMINIHIAI